MYIVYSKDGCLDCLKAIALLQHYRKDVRVVKLGEDITVDAFKAANPEVRRMPVITLENRTFTSLQQLNRHLTGDE